MRRAWLRGRENLHKRYLTHVAGTDFGLIMRLTAVLLLAVEDQIAFIIISIQADPLD